MYWIGTIVLVLVILSFWRHLHQKYATLKFKYKIYSLRDSLRKMTINGEVEPNWMFDFFDTSLSKAISESYYITLFRLSTLATIHEKDQELMKFSEKLENEISLYPKIKRIQEEYILAVKSYVLDQHYVSINFILKPLAVLILGTATAAYKFNQWLRGILVYPETSASEKFAY